MNQRSLLLAVCVVAVAIVSPKAVQACAVCLTGAAGADPIADAFNWSILFLMAMPYTIVGSIGGWLFYAHRRATEKRGGLREKAPFLPFNWMHKEKGR
ncbi:MAG: hypothetical protein O7B35_13295 [Deltaproteobacteria bacterium]|nr:hypothetical protein [Deltaproteobacteria bacterium]